MAVILWEGSISGAWDTAGNWDLARIPITGDDVDLSAANLGNQCDTGPSVAITLNSITLSEDGWFGNDIFGNVTITDQVYILGCSLGLGSPVSFVSIGGDYIAQNGISSGPPSLSTGSVGGTCYLYDSAYVASGALTDVYFSFGGVSSSTSISGTATVPVGGVGAELSCSWGGSSVCNISGELQAGDLSACPTVNLYAATVNGGTLGTSNVYANTYFTELIAALFTGNLVVYGSFTMDAAGGVGDFNGSISIRGFRIQITYTTINGTSVIDTNALSAVAVI